MDKIYAAAKVTIIAAAGSDPNYGLPGVSSTPREIDPFLVDIDQTSFVALPSIFESKTPTTW